ncbi:metallophosphoesterase [Arthrobacter mobilis]|uniref:Metallophosphoesterase n=1 Tax=Arthrobacter mobilis TaxID=2724944 RepID=A0A7X6HF92_9MICC|nr:metallophosphoesterase [Arthrobacter mobilis]NKX55275.1 metallophosphoesterase [Arthrobacter mobilis]
MDAALIRRRLAGAGRVAACAAAAGGAALAYGALVERHLFSLREETLPILPPGRRPLKLLHLSDIHLVPGQKLKQKWLRSLADTRPDLVVNTGDNLSHHQAVPPLLDALDPLLEFPGVFVPGSNDYYAPVAKNPFTYFTGPSKPPTDYGSRELPWRRMHSAFGNSGWIDLSNRHQSLVVDGLRLDFTGVDDPHLGRDRYSGFPRGSASADQAAHLRIAVAHAPYQRVLDYFTDGGAELILAGHTHGGQVCVPGYGALVSNCDLPTWRARGLTWWEHAGRQVPLNVSAGIGTSRMAPVRFACRPEAVLLSLVAKPS